MLEIVCSRQIYVNFAHQFHNCTFPILQATPGNSPVMRKTTLALITLALTACHTWAQRFELLNYGNFDQWITRNIKESRVLGGATKQVYEVGPTAVDNSGNAYSNRGGSPWATSNVLAKPSGITKTSNAVYPEARCNGKCAKLVCEYEHCKALGIINIDVIVGGSLFTGQMLEPIKSTSNPYSKMIMGVPFKARPKSLRFDYQVKMPAANERIYSSGFGSKKTLPGRDHAEALIYLQRRWEDAKGNIYAKRVGTGIEKYTKSTGGWVNAHDMKIVYGNPAGKPGATADMKLIPAEKSYYARNSKGKMVPVKEVGWDDPNATPTHMIVMFSASGGEPYTGSLGLTLWVDNVGLVY